jgi:hypothetical protein
MIEYCIAFTGGLLVFVFLLWILREGGGPAVVAAIPKPKNPIGFALA